MGKKSAQQSNVQLLSKVLQKRRKIGNNFFTADEWLLYKQRILTRLENVKEEAIRTKNLSPEQMLMNFFDLVNSSYKIKKKVELMNE